MIVIKTIIKMMMKIAIMLILLLAEITIMMMITKDRLITITKVTSCLLMLSFDFFCVNKHIF